MFGFSLNRRTANCHRSAVSHRNIRTRQLLSETLERREVMAASLSAGVLTITGSNGPDDVVVKVKTTVFGHYTVNRVTVLEGGVATLTTKSPVTHVRFYGLGGDDKFVGSTMNVPIFAEGGDGNDTLIGGSAADTLIGNADRDTIRGGGEADRIYGDHVPNHYRSDLQYQGDVDLLYGDDGDDTIFGGVGDDKIYGGRGDDTLLGGAGADFGISPSGNDTIFGEAGVDTLMGQDGDDILDGGTDHDKLYGDLVPGTGKDTFHQYWLLGVAEDKIFDYRPIEDGDLMVGHIRPVSKLGS